MTKAPNYTKEERELLRKVYPAGGVEAAVAALPHRSKASLASKASEMGLKMTSGARGALQKRRKAESQAEKGAPPKRYERRGEPSPLDSVPPEYEKVASVFHIGERIKK